MVNWCSGKKQIVACFKFLSSNFPFDYVDDHDKPLPLECDRTQISIRDIRTPCRSSRVVIISLYVYDSLMTFQKFPNQNY